MSGPSAAYLAALQQGLNPIDAGAAASGMVPPAPAPAVTSLVDPSSAASLPPGVGNVPLTLPGIAPAPSLPPAGPPLPPPPEPAGAPPPTAAPAGPPPPPGEGPSELEPARVQFQQVGGGTSPARELYMRGPQANAHMLAAYEKPEEAAGQIGLRNILQAQHEEAMYERQAEAAQARQDASERVVARRQQEMQSMAMDYQEQIQKLGEMHLDQNRYFANMSTGDKIGNTIALFMGGFFGGPNIAFQRIMKQADQDIEAQKFDYNVALNQARGTKTAYGMLMDRYGSEDAATAAARAAALDYAASKVSQEQASWKGVNAQNQTDQLLAEISKAREMEIANGFKFIPAQSSAPRYQMAFRGHVAPGTFSEEQAKTEWLKHQTEQGEKADETILHGEVQAGVANATERAKAAAEKSNYGPLGKAGTEKMALEQAEAERERNGIVSSIDDSIRNVKAIVRGGIISDAVANALPPSLVSGPTKDLNEREAYNVRAMMAVAAKYKINTDAMEPKNLELLKKYSAPYVIPSGASEDTARNKMALLKRDVGLAARARGVEPSVPAKLPPSARYPGEGK